MEWTVDQLRQFVTTADCGSFSAAAEELGLAKTTVSKAVTRLEERMRTTLLHRTTRQVTPTQDGLLFHARCQQLIAVR